MIGRMIQYFKRELNLLLITILVLITKRETIISNMYTIGSNYLFIYNAKIRNTILFKIGGEIVLN